MSGTLLEQLFSQHFTHKHFTHKYFTHKHFKLNNCGIIEISWTHNIDKCLRLIMTGRSESAGSTYYIVKCP